MLWPAWPSSGCTWWWPCRTQHVAVNKKLTMKCELWMMVCVLFYFINGYLIRYLCRMQSSQLTLHRVLGGFRHSRQSCCLNLLACFLLNVNMDTRCASEKEVTFYKTMKYHNPEDQNIKLCCCENPKFHVGLFQ